MVNTYNKVINAIADEQHKSWVHWSKELAIDLERIKQMSAEEEFAVIYHSIDSRLSRWNKLWVPYTKLSKEMKDIDREWAEKVITLIPIRCPVYQCGGFMQHKMRKVSKLAKEFEHYDGDEQTPDLICTNCKAIYQFKGFKDEKRKTVLRGRIRLSDQAI
jgi:hypothetical protein